MQHCCLKGFIVEFVFVFTFLIVVISQFKMLNFQKLVKRIGRRDSAKDDQPSFQQILVINYVDVYEKRNRWIFRTNNKVVTKIYPLFFPVIVALLFWFGRFFFFSNNQLCRLYWYADCRRQAWFISGHSSLILII